jgi:hypothetical protein
MLITICQNRRGGHVFASLADHPKAFAPEASRKAQIENHFDISAPIGIRDDEVPTLGISEQKP